MNFMFWRNQKPLDIQFADTTRLAYPMHPIQMAKDIKPLCHKKQMTKYKKYLFSHCPGMIDYAQYGYIIPAWDDIHIISNKAGVSTRLGGNGKRHTLFAAARKMDATIVDGIFNPDYDGLAQPVHIASPWAAIVNNKHMSLFLLPAVYHSPFLDDLFVYPGIVDYGKFTSLNFIFATKRDCNITIPAGTPLMHVVPFEAKGITAGYGPADDYQIDKSKSIISTSKQFYRKYIKHNKPTTIDVIE